MRLKRHKNLFDKYCFIFYSIFEESEIFQIQREEGMGIKAQWTQSPSLSPMLPLPRSYSLPLISPLSITSK